MIKITFVQCIHSKISLSKFKLLIVFDFEFNFTGFKFIFLLSFIFYWIYEKIFNLGYVLSWFLNLTYHFIELIVSVKLTFCLGLLESRSVDKILLGDHNLFSMVMAIHTIWAGDTVVKQQQNTSRSWIDTIT